MRCITGLFGIATVAIALLAGCSAATQDQIPMAPGSTVSQVPLSDLVGPSDAQPMSYAGLRDLYVTRSYAVSFTLTGEVDIFTNKGFKPDGSIAGEFYSPYGVFLDRNGNLYVADLSDVTEFAPHSSIPKFMYTARACSPMTASVDRRGHVYEADYCGFVAEYPQGRNIVLHACSLFSDAVRGVAVDKAGNVFVAYDLGGSSDNGRIVEYSGGLKGCKGRVLGVTLDYAGGIAIDRNGNLIACDMNKPAVDVIDPPYKRITRTLGSGFRDPVNVTINLNNTRAFVADIVLGRAYVLDYASGKLITTVDGGQVGGAVDGPNAVY